jgi:hypothetical protein
MASSRSRRRAGSGWIMLLIVATLGVLAIIGATILGDPNAGALPMRAGTPSIEPPALPAPRLPPVNPPGVPDGAPPIAPRG